MPFTTNLRLSAQGKPGAQKEVAALAERPEVHDMFARFRSGEPALRRTQLEMVAIAAPPFGEHKRAEWLKARFQQLGLKEVEIDSVGNVTGLLPGKDASAELVMLSAHIDTVFPPGTPVQPREDGDRMLAPGISDNGAGVMAMLAVADAFIHSKLEMQRGILFVGNVGEEGEGDLRGMRYLFKDSKWKDRIGQAVVIDGAGVDTVVTQALGSHRFEVTVRGPGGHSWSDFGLPNPVVILARAIATFSRTTVPTDPKTSFNIGTITGGTSVNSIPESASARIDIRSSSQEQIERVEKALRSAVEAELNDLTAPARKSVTAEVKPIGTRPAGELPANARLLEVIRAVDAHLGLPSETRRASTDANIPLSLGKEAISIGGGGDGGGAHTVHEWFNPAGRDLGLKRVLLTVLTLAHPVD